MKVDRIDNMFRGWFIGDFEPSIYRTKEFEVSYMRHQKGERWAPHYHRECVEINYLIRGSMTIQGRLLSAGDLFMFDKGEVADPIFHEDVELIVVKTPSIPNDKHIVEG